MSRLFSIEGNIGSGKSTLIKMLKENKYNKNIIFMEEPVSKWVEIKDSNGCNMIEKFYSNKKRYAFSFQIMAFITRLSMIKEYIKKNPHATIICERSINTDRNVFAKMLYDEGYIEDVEYQIYLNWFDEFINDIPNTGIIYVKTDPKISNKRVLKRKRKGEDIPLTYLERCHVYHEEWISTTKVPVLKLFGDEDKKSTNDYQLWLNIIEQFVKDYSNTNNDDNNSSLYDQYVIGMGC